MESAVLSQIVPEGARYADTVVASKYDFSVFCAELEVVETVLAFRKKTEFKFGRPASCHTVNEGADRLNLFFFCKYGLCRLVRAAAGNS